MRLLEIVFLTITITVLAPSRAEQTQEKDYFPMHVGDTWIYRVGDYYAPEGVTETVTIKEKVNIEGKEYYHFVYFVSSNISGMVSEERELYYARRDSLDRIVIRGGADDGIMYKLNPADNEPWWEDDIIVRVVVSWDTTVTVEAGTFEHCIIVERIDLDMSSCVFYWLAPGVGEVKIASGLWGKATVLELIEATIDGRRYGKKTAVKETTWSKIKEKFKKEK